MPAAATTTTASLQPSPDMGALRPTKLGKDMRQWFPFPSTFRMLNQGSFGSTPTPVLGVRSAYLAQSDSRPDLFQRVTAPAALLASREAYATLLRAPHTDVVIVPNTTTGVNAVLRNLPLGPGDRVLHFDFVYGAVLKTVLSVCEGTGARPAGMRVALDDGGAGVAGMPGLLARTVAALRAQGFNPAVAVFDTFVSSPGVRLPWEQLVAKCRELGVLSLLDGAHGVGAVPLDLPALDPDFFVSNGHKWLFVPRGCAVLYVPQRNQHFIRTGFPTSHGFQPKPLDGEETDVYLPFAPGPGEESAFALAFRYVATIDVTPWLCVPAALEFREKVCGGEEAIMKYCSDLALQGGKLVAEILGTNVMDDEAGAMTDGCPLVNIRLPVDLKKVAQPETVQKWLQEESMFRHDTFVKIDQYRDWLYVRLSAQVFLDLEDFEFAGKMLQSLCSRVEKGEHVAGEP